MEIRTQVEKIDAMVSQGDIVNAVKDFFAKDVITSDYDGKTTNGKSQMIEKMEGFLSNIAKVNRITLHRSIIEDNVSASEFTFDFDMKDGSKIYWHEIIQRVWSDQGEVIEEEYFNAN